MGLAASGKFSWGDLTERWFSLDTYFPACAKDWPWTSRPHDGGPHIYAAWIKCPAPRNPGSNQYVWFERPPRPRYQGKRNRDAGQTRKLGTSGQQKPTTPQCTANSVAGSGESPSAHHSIQRPAPATSHFGSFHSDPVPLLHDEILHIESRPPEGWRF